MALPEEFAFFFLLEGTAFLALLGLLALGSWEAPMDGAAIFELDLALLDPRFLDFEFGQSRLRVAPRSARPKPAQKPQPTAPSAARRA